MLANKPKVTSTHQLQQSVRLVKAELQHDAYLYYIYTLYVDRLTYATISANFQGSYLVEISDKEGLRTEVTVQPFSNKEVARLKLGKGWKLNSNFKLSLKTPPKQMQLSWIKVSVQRLLKAYVHSKLVFQTIATDLAPINFLIQRLHQFGLNFIDPEFAPLGSQNICDEELLQTLIEWRRPSDFMKQQYRIIGSLQGQHVQKGMLDCNQLYSVLRALTCKTQLIKRIFVTKEINQQGIYRLVIFSSGFRRQITIDDYIPCFPLEKPYSLRSLSDQIWPLFIQKALAKFIRSYSLVASKSINQLMLDLTGCPGQFFNFRKQTNILSLVQRVNKRLQQNSLIVGWVGKQQHSQEQLLPQCNFAYPMLQCNPAKRTFTFLIGQSITQLTFDQARTRFQFIYCIRTKTWLELRLKGKFVWGQDTFSKHQFMFSKWSYSFQLQKQTSLVLGLHQEDSKVRFVIDQRPSLDLSLFVFKKGKNKQLNLVFMTDYQISRQIFLDLTLQAGQYLIVPKTSGCQLMSKSSKPALKSVCDQDGQFRGQVLQSIKDIYRRFDLFLNESMQFNELKSFYETVGVKLTSQRFKTILNLYQFKIPGVVGIGLTPKGFLRIWKQQLDNQGEDSIWQWLNRCGYSKSLRCNKSRIFGLTLHACQQLMVTMRDAIQSGIDNKCNILLIKNRGKVSDLSKQGVKILIAKSGLELCYSYGVLNQNAYPVQVQLDMKRSIDCLCSDPSWTVKKRVESGQTQFLLNVHLISLERQILIQQVNVRRL